MAFPLRYPDDSIEEIRASHILEHFSFADAQRALKEWVRVLKPGGRIRLAVPGFEKIVEIGKTDSAWPFYLMGGQTDAYDFHQSVWTEQGLRDLMTVAGLKDVSKWESSNGDCASLPVSLNLEGVKNAPEMVKIWAVMGIPRYGANDAWGQIFEALAPFRIPLYRYQGVFWGQCMQRAFNEAIQTFKADWILTIDHDSMFTAHDLDILMGEFGENADIDALAAIQPRRGHMNEYPLLTIGGTDKVEVSNKPFKVTTAHFGLTLIRTDALKQVAKPWFWSKPGKDGEWDDDRLDDDIWFWHQWRLAGKNIYVSTNCRIGHLENMVTEFNEDMTTTTMHVPTWREKKKKGVQQCVSDSSSDGAPTAPVESPVLEAVSAAS